MREADRTDPLAGAARGRAERFLGPISQPESPFELLGLPPALYDQREIASALSARLAKIDAHPHARSRDAEELRLALHAAAAHLGEASMAPELARRWGSPGPAQSPPRDEIRQIIGVAGGFNAQARRRIAQLAVSRGLQPSQLLGAAPARAVEPAEIAAATESSHAAPTPSSRSLGPVVVLLAAAVFLLAVIVAGLLAAVLWASRASRASAPAPISAPAATPPVAQAPPAAAPIEEDPQLVLRRLVACPGVASADAAGACLEEVLPVAGRVWTRWPKDQRLAAIDAVIESVHKLAAHLEPLDGALAALTRAWQGPRARLRGPDVLAVCWAVGVLGRLGQDSSLPPAALERIRQRLLSIAPGVGDGGFEQSVEAILDPLSRSMVGQMAANFEEAGAVEPWEAWLAAMSAVAAPSSGTHILAAIERAMKEAPDPLERAGVGLVLERLARAVAWDQEAAKEALLRWLDDPAVSGGDLSVVTGVLVRSSTDRSLQSSMILSPAADAAGRAQVRELFRAAWGRARDPLREEWTKLATQHRAPAAPSVTLADELARAVVLARLCRVAGLIEAGQRQEAARLLDLAVLAPALAPVPSPVPPSVGESASTWAPLYAAVRGGELGPRLEMLSRADTGGTLHPVDARIIIEECLRASPAAVRKAAEAIVRRRGSELEVLTGLLEESPTMPATREVSRLLEDITLTSLPSPDEPRWRAAVRGALLERVLGRQGGGQAGRVDSLAQALRDEYAGLLLTLDPAASADAPPARLAQSLAERWGPPALPGRGRLALAQGPVQEFVAWQTIAAESLADLTRRQRPGRAGVVAKVISDLRTDLARRGHIFEQLAAAQGAMLDIWQARLGGEEP